MGLADRYNNSGYAGYLRQCIGQRYVAERV
jgi:hypothetical protein